MMSLNLIKILDLISLTTLVIGDLLIAFAVLSVHARLLDEHKIDRKVFSSVRQEKMIAVWGIALILFGFVVGLISIFTS